MVQQLGEAVEVGKIKQGDLVWYEGAYRLVTQTESVLDGEQVLYLLDVETPLYYEQEEKVVRAGWYMVAKRVSE